ncbi:MAG: hypothetical protein K9H64_22645 [Bacteroidales bacterium]|nr:hypothetical protein [Bacteroidales bacterium]MCF8458842.1 hypothetical protein [Bacteroidales bacterium]
MFRIIAVFIFLGSFGALVAQTGTDIPDYYNPGDSIFVSGQTPSFLQAPEKKIDFGVEMGTSVGSMSGQTLFSSYISPYARYPLSDRFSLEVGTTIARGNSILGYSPYYGETFMPVGSNLLQTSFYAKGRYMVNQNLTVFGTGYVQRNIFLSPIEGDERPDFDTRAMSFGMEYKLGENARIQIEVQTGNSTFHGFQNQSPLGYPGNINPARQ